MSVVNTNSIMDKFLPAEESVPYSDSNQDLGKDAFLKLLITQMQHQDPLNPLEGIEFTQQLAQFTSLEQLYNINDNFAGMNTALQAQNNYRAVDMVGKEVKATGNVLSVQDGQSTTAAVNLKTPAASVIVSIFDQYGLRIRTIDLGPMTAGEHQIEWDGKDGGGRNVPDGTYEFEVGAYDTQQQEIDLQTWAQGTVNGVRFDQEGNPLLLINGLQLQLSDIFEIVAPRTEDEAAGEA